MFIQFKSQNNREMAVKNNFDVVNALKTEYPSLYAENRTTGVELSIYVVNEAGDMRLKITGCDTLTINQGSAEDNLRLIEIVHADIINESKRIYSVIEV